MFISLHKKHFEKSPRDLIAAKVGAGFVNVPEAQFGDYSSNAAMVLAKQAGKAPMILAEELVEQLRADAEVGKYFSKIEAVKPGFINFSLSGEYLAEILHHINKEPDTFGAGKTKKKDLVMVEYFQLNVAKPPHVGHLRSAVIGDSLKRIFISQGYKTVSDTHIGDWGTQFGILLWAYKNLDGRGKINDRPLEQLNELYIEANAAIEADPEIREKAKAEFALLEAGDRDNRRLWEFFVSVSKKEFNRMVERLELLPFEYDLGESFYEDLMKIAIEKLRAASLLKVGETGEKYVDLEEHGLGRLICIKSDGATTYGLRDLATLYYRYEHLVKKEKSALLKNVYVVDARQSHHLQQVFKALELLGEHDAGKSIHVDFGFMSLPEGALSTRKGNIIALESLIEEAQNRALEIINQKNAGLQNKEEVARAVGLGAIKYADLSHNRKGDVVFRWDDVLSFEGNTGPYLQYTHARLCSILRKAGVKPSKLKVHEIGEAEQALVRQLSHFPEVLAGVVEDYLPSNLATYLYETASLANNYYHSTPVMQELDENIRNMRLAVVNACGVVLRNGLYLLGIKAPEEM